MQTWRYRDGHRGRETESRNAKGDKRNRNGKGETEQRKIRKMEVR